MISFETFVRLPWVSWAAPKAVRSDMSGPSLLGLVGAELIGGDEHEVRAQAVRRRHAARRRGGPHGRRRREAADRRPVPGGLSSPRRPGDARGTGLIAAIAPRAGRGSRRGGRAMVCTLAYVTPARIASTSSSNSPGSMPWPVAAARAGPITSAGSSVPADRALTRRARRRGRGGGLGRLRAQEHADAAVGVPRAEMDVRLRHVGLEVAVRQPVLDRVREAARARP